MSNVRQIFSSSWGRQGDEFVYTVRGSGFLHHMVRNLVGTFLLVGKGTLKPSDLMRILESRSTVCGRSHSARQRLVPGKRRVLSASCGGRAPSPAGFCGCLSPWHGSQSRGPQDRLDQPRHGRGFARIRMRSESGSPRCGRPRTVRRNPHGPLRCAQADCASCATSNACCIRRNPKSRSWSPAKPASPMSKRC